MTEPRRIDEGDTLSINARPFKGETFEVEDTNERELGLTTIYAVALRSDTDETYTLSHAEGSREVSIEGTGVGDEKNVPLDSIRVE